MRTDIKLGTRKWGIALAAAATFALGAGVAYGTIPSSNEQGRAPRAFTVQLLPRNGFDMTGKARFVPRAKRSFWVTVTAQGGPGGSYMAHVHTGPCSKEPTFANPRLWNGLNNVVNGRSRTLVRGSLAQYRRGKYSLNVHEPGGELRPMACGDLPRRF